MTRLTVANRRTPCNSDRSRDGKSHRCRQTECSRRCYWTGSKPARGTRSRSGTKCPTGSGARRKRNRGWCHHWGFHEASRACQEKDLAQVWTELRCGRRRCFWRDSRRERFSVCRLKFSVPCTILSILSIKFSAGVILQRNASGTRIGQSPRPESDDHRNHRMDRMLRKSGNRSGGQR